MKVKCIQQEYIDWLKELFLEHGIYNKLQSSSRTTYYPVSDEVACYLEDIDLLITSMMLFTGKKRYKLNTAHCESILEAKWWIDRCHAFRQLIRLQMGKNANNIGNVKRFAQQMWN